MLRRGDGGHGRYADEAGTAGPADAAPRAAADGAPPPRTNRPREGQCLPSGPCPLVPGVSLLSFNSWSAPLWYFVLSQVVEN